MNREIKFRAWDKVKKEMFNPVGEIDLNQEGVMQYTGLKDKNGKEIYEGDILRHGKFVERVLWDRNAAFVRLNQYGWGGNFPYGKGWYKNCEVIGNIHQHPELIKES